jgi:hypothetical protein
MSSTSHLSVARRVVDQVTSQVTPQASEEDLKAEVA